MTITVLEAFDGRNEYAPETAERLGRKYYDVKKEEVFLTKTIHANGYKKQAQNLKLYRLGYTYFPKSLEELHPLLLKAENDPHSMWIRYSYRKVFSRGQLVHRNRTNYNEGDTSPVIAIDIDNLQMPYIKCPIARERAKTDIAMQGDYVINILHKCVPDIIPCDTGFIAQGSSSSAISEGIRLHLWICNDYKLSQAQIKKFFSDVNAAYRTKFNKDDELVDLALYSIGQPHYMSKPVFVGMEDPYKDKDRTVFQYGAKARIPESIVAYESNVVLSDEVKDGLLSRITGFTRVPAVLESKLDSLGSWIPRNSGARRTVISCYHTALQCGFDLDLLDEMILKLLKPLRPGKELEYIRQGRAAAVNNWIVNSQRELSTSVLGISAKALPTNDDFFVRINKEIPDNTVLYLKASLGTGKTTNVVDILKSYGGSFLTITNNTALVDANAARFGSGVYSSEQDRFDLARGELKKFSSTIHSLWKFKDYKFDFVFIDEADATLSDLLTASIIDEPKRKLIKESLAQILIASNIVILSDGDLSRETMVAYTDLMAGQKDILTITHERENLKNVIADRHKSVESLLGAFAGSLCTGSKCLLVSDLSPTKLNSIYNTFQRVHPEKVGVVMHQHSKKDEAFQDIINNTNRALHARKVDYILASPSITNGVDFNYFDDVFVITTTANQPPNLRFQALKRERNASRVHYYTGRVSGYNSGYSLVPETGSWLEDNVRSIELRKERECKNYEATFDYYLLKAGCTIECIDEPYENPQTQMDKEMALLDRAVAIYEGSAASRNNDGGEVKPLYEALLQDSFNVDNIVAALKSRIEPKAALLASVINDFWYVLRFKDESKLMEELSGVQGHKFAKLSGLSLPKLRSSKGVKLRVCKDILKQLGLLDPDGLEYYIRYCLYNNIPVHEDLRNIEEGALDL